MSKRNKIVLKSPESKALKKLREQSDLSIRKVADKIGISMSRVSQMESGRDDIQKEYIIKFLDALERSWQDWVFKIEKDDNSFNLRDRCHEALDKLSSSQLEKAYELLRRL